MFVSRMIFAMKLYIILPLSLNKYINHVFLILKPICFYKWLLVILEKCVIQFFPLIWKIFVQSQHIFVNLVSGKTLKTPFFFKSPYIHILRYTGYFWKPIIPINCNYSSFWTSLGSWMSEWNLFCMPHSLC